MIVFALLVALCAVPVVSAHANLVTSTPSSGDQLDEPPDELVLEYSEGVQIADVTVESAEGEAVGGEVRVDEDDQAVVHVALDPSGNGTYVVQWEVLSVDGHTTRGSFFYVVGDEPPTREQVLQSYADDDDEAVPLLEAGLRSGYFAGVLVLVGAPITLWFVVHPLLGRTDMDRREVGRVARRLFAFVLLGVLLAATGIAYLQLPEQPPRSMDPLAQFLATDLGIAWLVRLGVVIALGMITVAHERISRRAWLGLVAVGGALLGLTTSWTSHSAAVIDGGVGTLADFGHVLGVALWFGGLVAVAVVGPLVLTHAERRTACARALIRRFSVLALAGVVVAGATGLVIAGWHVPSVASLGGTRYGTALSAKTLLALAAIGLGGLNRFVLHRRLATPADRERRRDIAWAQVIPIQISIPGRGRASGDTVRTFVRSVRLELALLLVVLVLSGMLASIPTAANVAATDVEPTEQRFEADVAGATLTVQVAPGIVGPNVFDVEMTADGAGVDPDEPVTLMLRHPDRGVSLPEVELERLDEGTYSLVEPIPGTGTWEVRLTTWIDGTYVSERFSVHVASAGTDHDDADGHAAHGSSGDGFGRTLQYGAGAVALLGLLAVAYEGRKLRRQTR